MRCVIRVSPNGEYDVIASRYVSGLRTSTYPATIPDVAVVGQPVRLVAKAPNYTATNLINRAISAVIDGYAFIYKADNGLDHLYAFTKAEAEKMIPTLIEEAGGKLCANF